MPRHDHHPTHPGKIPVMGDQRIGADVQCAGELQCIG